MIRLDREFWSGGLNIPPENYAKAAKAIRDAGLSRLTRASDKDVIENAVGLSSEYAERVFKVISRFVEPGSWVEYTDAGARIPEARYVFLFDTVERCTVPHILYSRREVI